MNLGFRQHDNGAVQQHTNIHTNNINNKKIHTTLHASAKIPCGLNKINKQFNAQGLLIGVLQVNYFTVEYKKKIKKKTITSFKKNEGKEKKKNKTTENNNTNKQTKKSKPKISNQKRPVK